MCLQTQMTDSSKDTMQGISQLGNSLAALSSQFSNEMTNLNSRMEKTKISAVNQVSQQRSNDASTSEALGKQYQSILFY